MKDIKSFFKDHEEDFAPDTDIEEIKNHLDLRQKSSFKEKSSFFDLKLVFSVLITILVVVPLTYFFSTIWAPTNTGDPNRDINQYLERNFDTYINSAVATELLTEDLFVSFYLAQANGEEYLVFHLNSNVDYRADFLINNLPLSINTGRKRIDKVTLNKLDNIMITIRIFKDEEFKKDKDIILDIDDYQNFFK